MQDRKYLGRFASRALDPQNVEFTNHFIDRLQRKDKDAISPAEIMSFFRRLGQDKEKFLGFLKRYKEFVVTDTRYNVNIPFIRVANKIIAKTVMRKRNFTSSNPKFKFEKKGEKKDLDDTGFSFIDNTSTSKSISRARSMPLSDEDKIRLIKKLISRVKSQYKNNKVPKKRAAAKAAFKRLHNLIDTVNSSEYSKESS